MSRPIDTLDPRDDDVATPTIGSLFSGIGGLELGVEQAIGGRVVWQVESDKFCRLILARHWPQAYRGVVDVSDEDATARLARVDVIVGGFPCQDVSKAGTQRGLEGERSGLWRHFARLVAALRPLGVVVENSGDGLWPRWLPVVRSDLHALGYASVPMEVRADDVGAPHRRARCFVIAANTDGEGLARRQALRGRAPRARAAPREIARRWAPRAPIPDVCRVGNGVRRGLDARRLRALGNAVVPDVAYVVGRELAIALDLDGDGEV